MHKIKKGIKKKIKGKKGKEKDDDLFDPDQLAKFKLELEEKAAAAAASSSAQQHSEEGSEDETHPEHHPDGEPPSQQDEEWLKFKLLTSGVDSILKKTSGDLDRIKSTSFFQRTPPNPSFIIPPGHSRPPPPHHPPVVHRDKKGQETATQWIHTQAPSPTPTHEKEHPQEASVPEDVPPAEEPVVAEPEEDEDVIVDDDLFDTTLADRVLTGEIQLAYIPDSPTEPEDGDDPFDTSVALHVVQQIEEEEKRKKRQVNLGVAVNVLTGAPAPANASTLPTKPGPSAKSGVTATTRRARPHPVNLLGDFGDASPQPTTADAPSAQPNDVLDIFDCVSVPDNLPDDLQVIPVQQTSHEDAQPVRLTPDKNSHLLELLSEFDVIDKSDAGNKVTEHLLTPEEDLEDEFAALAQESLHSKPEHSTPARPPPPTKPPPPGQAHAQPEKQEAEVEEDAEPEEEDPFDTKFVDSLVKSENSGDFDDDFDFDPRAGESGAEGADGSLGVKKDLLGGSCSDLSSFTPIHPESDTLIQPEIQDPFDTSTLDQLVPGKAELKLLERELLTGPQEGHPPPNDDFDDFDPRKDEVKVEDKIKSRAPPRPQPPKHPHLFDAVDSHAEDGVGGVKALTPQVDTALPEEPEDIDPFDTSSVSHVTLLPGKAELKLLESQFVSPGQSAAPGPTGATFQETDQDFDFNPRAFAQQQHPHHGILDSELHQQITDIKPLSPTTHLPPADPQQEDIHDPFDTSNFHGDNLLPGKAELKYLEKEFLHDIQTPPAPPPTFVPTPLPPPTQPPPPQEPPPPPQPHLLEEDQDWDACATLEPIQPKGKFDLDDQPTFDDPFDTTIAQHILPGKAELKILEDELGFGTNQQRRLSDPEFDPRQSIHPSLACQSNPLIPQTAASSAFSGADPFDTSASNSTLPGKAELKFIEAELL